MTGFRAAVRAARGALSRVWRPGLGALRGTHTALVRARRPRSITGSVGLDEALSKDEPGASRWDYGLGYRHADGVERAHWIEVHPATDKEVRPVLAKLTWLKTHLEENAPGLLEMTGQDVATPAFAWIHTGYDHVRRASPSRRLLAESGVRGPLRHLELP